MKILNKNELNIVGGGRLCDPEYSLAPGYICQTVTLPHPQHHLHVLTLNGYINMECINYSHEVVLDQNVTSGEDISCFLDNNLLLRCLGPEKCSGQVYTP